MAGVKGLDEVISNINDELRKMKDKTMAGLWEAGLEIERKSKEMTPVDTGNLRGSAYTRRLNAGVEVGYTAEYALWVHEMVGEKLKGRPRKSGSRRGTYWESGESKFLEKAVFDTDIIGIVRRRARVS